MPTVSPCPLPEEALLTRYRRAGVYLDCYASHVEADVALPRFVSAFYSTPLFKLERLILRGVLRLPSTDADAVALGLGTRDSFAAWSVEQRRDDQLLLRDLSGRTRSWLMTRPLNIEGKPATQLLFGSAVVPRFNVRHGREGLGWWFRALLGFHRVYSRALLRAACTRLGRTRD